MYALHVGQPYDASRSHWIDGSSQFSVGHSGARLTLFFANPRDFEIEDYGAGDAVFALAVHGQLLFLLYRFGRQQWADAPYSVHNVPPEHRPSVPVLAGDQRLMLHVVLVDAATGLVRALRVLTLPPDLTMRLFAALADQLQRPWHGREAHDRELASICRRFPTSKALLETAITRGRGGS